MRAALTVLAALFLLSACFLVKDFGEYWDKGYLDPELAGSWSQGKNCMQFVADGDDYIFRESKKEIKTRTLDVGKHRFMMQKDESMENGGSMFKYTIQKNTLVFYSMNEKKAPDFLKQYGNNPNITISGVDKKGRKKKDENINIVAATVSRLDAETLKILEKISNIPSYWEPQKPLKRSDCAPNKDES